MVSFPQRTNLPSPLRSLLGMAYKALHNGFPVLQPPGTFQPVHLSPDSIKTRGGGVWVTHSPTHWLSLSALPTPETEDLSYRVRKW